MSTVGSKLQAAPPPGWHDMTTSSLSSSAASLHSTPASHSNNRSDHSAASTTPGPVNEVAVSPISPRARSSSLALAMGQNYSRAPTSSSTPEPVLPQPTSKLGNVASSTGFKLKRVFATRRKHSEGFSQAFFSNGKGKERERIEATSSAPSSSAPSLTAQAQVTAPSPRFRKGPKQLTLQLASQVVSGGKKLTKTQRQSLSPPPLSPPPPPPPKPVAMQATKKSPPSPVDTSQFTVDNHGSIIPISPGISSAVNYLRLGEEQREREQEHVVALGEEKEQESEKANTDKGELKEGWRKSDSTMSHHTIRPGATVGSRTPRPVSMAESLQSNHTIVPANKQLSALLAGAEFDMLEEDDSFKSMEEDRMASWQNASPQPSPRTKNRRSLSLNLGSTIYAKAQVASPTSASVAEIKYPSKSISEGVPISPSASSETPTLTRAAANGIIAPANTSMHSPGSSIRGHLAAWSATTNNSQQSVSPSRHDRNLPEIPPAHPHRSPILAIGQPQPPPSFRQTAISITSGFAPAAGLAKRAVEKMGRAWGGIGSGSGNSSSGYSSSSSGTAPSSYSSVSHLDHALGRTSSDQSATAAASGKSKPRRTPNAPSGSWSVNSSVTSGSFSDSDAFLTPAGPVLGARLRGPMRMKVGGVGVAGGVVFGRDLRTVVRETAIQAGKTSVDMGEVVRRVSHARRGSVNKSDLMVLEKRLLPALVVRCAQHLLIWGLQEEGLFRVSGRPSHVAKLRSEFDTGADFDMMECSPGDLDPHAVASIFKAYLRELPEPILTRALIPFFDAAMTAESNSNPQEHTELPRIGGRGPTLPSGPRSGLPMMRKPPSLSTLAMPSFTGMRPPSKSLLNAIKTLIAQLPQENRDLIRTVTDLIKATAKASKETKMPLSNLLLVFCPSLNMNPPLLRVLCEDKGIWDDSQGDPSVLDIKGDSAVLDIGVSSTPSPIDKKHDPEEEVDADDDDEQFCDAMDGTEPDHQNSEEMNPWESLALEEELGEMNVVRPRPSGGRRAPVPVATIYLDSESGAEDYSLSNMVASNAAHARTPSAAPSSETTSLQDDVSYVSISEGNSIPSPTSRPDAPSPPLSSSAESLATPPTSSGRPSFSHLPLGNDPCTKLQPLGAPVIAESTELPLPPTPRRPVISGPIGDPVQFPLTTTSSPTGTSLSHKMLIPTLSLPNFASISDSQSANSSPRIRRLKKPSLRLLFSKRSASPLTSPSTHLISGPYLQPPRASSDSSVSTPVSAVTAPQSSTFTLPPKLDTPIETSALQFELGIALEDTQPLTIHKKQQNEEKTDVKVDVAATAPRPLNPGETPIADRYHSASSSVLSLASLANSQPPLRMPRLQPTLRSKQSMASISSTASSNHLGLLDDDNNEEDWTQSVLMAADVDGGWNIRHPN